MQLLLSRLAIASTSCAHILRHSHFFSFSLYVPSYRLQTNETMSKKKATRKTCRQSSTPVVRGGRGGRVKKSKIPSHPLYDLKNLRETQKKFEERKKKCKMQLKTNEDLIEGKASYAEFLDHQMRKAKKSLFAARKSTDENKVLQTLEARSSYFAEKHRQLERIVQLKRQNQELRRKITSASLILSIMSQEYKRAVEHHRLMQNTVLLSSASKSKYNLRSRASTHFH